MAGTSFWTVWTSPAYGGSGSKPLGLLRQARSRVFSCAAFLRTNASAGPLAGIRPQPGALWLPWRTGRQATAPPLPQGPFLPAPISSASGMAGPTRSRYSTTAIGSMAKPIRPSLPSQSESPEPTGQDHAFSVGFAFAPDTVIATDKSGLEVRVSSAALKGMCGWAHTSLRRHGPKLETGGLAFGELNQAAEVLWVSEVEGPPPDSDASEHHFTCGVAGMQEANEWCLRCLLLVMCTHPFAKKALTLHLARSEGHERYFGCNSMHRKVLASSHQHLMTEAPAAFGIRSFLRSSLERRDNVE